MTDPEIKEIKGGMSLQELARINPTAAQSIAYGNQKFIDFSNKHKKALIFWTLAAVVVFAAYIITR